MFATWNRAMVGRSALRLTLALVLLAASLVTIGMLTAEAQVSETKSVTVTATIFPQQVNVPGVEVTVPGVEAGQICVTIDGDQTCVPLAVDDQTVEVPGQHVDVGPVEVSVTVTAAVDADVEITGPTIAGTCVSVDIAVPAGADASVAVEASAQGMALLNVSQPIAADRTPSASVSVCA